MENLFLKKLIYAPFKCSFIVFQLLARLNLLPSRESEVDEYTKAFKLLEDTMMRNFPAILLATMKMFCAEYTKLK
jgi:hypothetical protein